MGLRMRLDVILSFTNHLFPDKERTEEFKELSNWVRNDLGRKRNLYVHAEWFETRSDGTAVGLSYRSYGKLIEDSIKEPIANLQAVVEAIDDTNRKVQNWQALVFRGYDPRPTVAPLFHRDINSLLRRSVKMSGDRRAV